MGLISWWMRICGLGCWRSTFHLPLHGKNQLHGTWLDFWPGFLLIFFHFSDSPLDLKIKSNMMADLFSLVGEHPLKFYDLKHVKLILIWSGCSWCFRICLSGSNGAESSWEETPGEWTTGFSNPGELICLFRSWCFHFFSHLYILCLLYSKLSLFLLLIIMYYVWN